MRVVQRDVAATTPQELPTISFYHPEMQRAVLEAAEEAGAEVRTGVRATSISNGHAPAVTVARNGGSAETVSARLVVGADGRNSPLRRWAQFDEHKERDRLYIAGVLLDRCRAPDDTVHSSATSSEGEPRSCSRRGRSASACT
jgi:2-polyprenyl-6-methoxyphenol hydroxylase-like FAD-dependent oxidoreductase